MSVLFMRQSKKKLILIYKPVCLLERVFGIFGQRNRRFEVRSCLRFCLEGCGNAYVCARLSSIYPSLVPDHTSRHADGSRSLFAERVYIIVLSHMS